MEHTENEQKLKAVIGMLADELNSMAVQFNVFHAARAHIKDIIDCEPLLDICVWCRESDEPPSAYIKWQSEMTNYHDDELGGHLCAECAKEAKKRDMEEARGDEIREQQREAKRERKE